MAAHSSILAWRIPWTEERGGLQCMGWQRVSLIREMRTCAKVEVLVAQSCLILCNPMDCSPPRSSVYGISQARILEWVAISSSRASA